MRQVMYLPFETNHASVYNRRDLNSSFAEGTLRVMYTGKNRNKSSIDREVIEDALPSLYNIPIVAHYDMDLNRIGGHDIELRRDADGKPYLYTLTVPCGLVPEHAVFSFENAEDENGVMHEYLVVDGVLLWKREPVYRHIDEDLGGKVDHSMEIGITDGVFDKETGLYRIKKFEFQALCLLERDEPCFEGSMLELYSLGNFKSRLAEMMQDLKESFSMVPSNREADQNHSKEGGETLEENQVIGQDAVESVNDDASVVLDSVCSECTIAAADDATFSAVTTAEVPVDDTCTESIEAVAEPASEGQGEQSEFALDSDLMREFCEIFGREKVEMPWGMDNRYGLMDYDADERKVYVLDYADWRLYSFDYVMSGDRVLVDFASKTRVRYAFVPYDNGVAEEPAASAFSHAAEKFTKMIGDLQAFKAETERKADEAAREAVFESFADLEGIEAFDELKRDNSGFSADALKEKCYAIRGRIGAPAKFSVAQKQPKLPVERRATEPAEGDEPYGGIVVRYRNKK